MEDGGPSMTNGLGGVPVLGRDILVFVRIEGEPIKI
jgi:hypothetical protein